MDVIAGLQHLFREVASKAPRSSVPTLVSATVVSVSPLTIILDSDVTGTPREADGTWVGSLRVGQEVRCELLGSDLTITQARPLSNDSGWLPVPLNAGFTGSLAVRVVSGIAYTRGEIAGSWTTTLQPVATYPAIARPVQWNDTYRPMQRGTVPGGARGYITAAGALNLACATGTASDSIYVSALSGYLTS